MQGVWAREDGPDRLRAMSRPTYVTTAQVCAAAGISGPTALRWSKAGLLPPYERVHGGKRGQFARWPAHAAEQAAWVKAKLAELLSFDEIRGLLAEGEFRPPPGGADGAKVPPKDA